MQVFVEFVKSDATEDQILPVLRQLLPILLAILKSPEVRGQRFLSPIADYWILELLLAHQDKSCQGFLPVCRGAVYGEGPTFRCRQRGQSRYLT
jgi:hypothetical protein